MRTCIALESKSTPRHNSLVSSIRSLPHDRPPDSFEFHQNQMCVTWTVLCQQLPLTPSLAPPLKLQLQIVGMQRVLGLILYSKACNPWGKPNAERSGAGAQPCYICVADRDAADLHRKGGEQPIRLPDHPIMRIVEFPRSSR